MDVPPAAEGLYALPPSRFTAERDALARSLAAGGDPAAGAVRTLRRPVGLAWLLNRLARERPADAEALLEAGDRLGTAQRRALAGGGAEALREAERDLRERARALRAEGARILASEGRREAPAVLARLELLLRVAATVRGEARDAFRRGVLAREPEIGGDLTGLSVLPGGRAGDRAGATGEAQGAGDGAGSRPAEARAARRVRDRELARLRRALALAVERSDRAERRAAQAEARAARERVQAEAEREAARRARERLDAAERDRP